MVFASHTLPGCLVQGTLGAALILGCDRIARFHRGISRWFPPARIALPVRINGLPGLPMHEGNGITQTLAFEIHGGVITALYVTRNPDKLRHVRVPVGASG